MEKDLIRRMNDMATDRAETSNTTIGTCDEANDDTVNRNNYSAIQNIEYQITHDYTKLPNDTRSINVLYVNMRSIKTQGRTDELNCILKMIPKTVHLILITESWLNEYDKNDTSLDLENYILVLGNRVGKRGGGVAAYIRGDMKFKYTEVIYGNGNNYLWVFFEEPRLNIGVVYYPGNTGEEAFLEDFKFQLEKIKGHDAVVLGDFNINVLETNESENFEKILQDTGFSVLNKKSKKYFTRKNINNYIIKSKRVIDLVCSNLKDCDYHLALIDSSLSDHRQVYFEIRNPELISKKQEENQNINSNWRKILDEAKKSTKDLKLEDEIIKIVYEHSKDLRQDDWITKKICDGITARNLLHQQFQKYPNEETKIRIVKANEAVNMEMELQKREHEILSLIKNGLNKRKIPSIIKIDSKSIMDSERICEEINNYFSNITSMGQNQSEPVMLPDIATSSEQGNQQNGLSKMPICTPKEINQIIVSLDPHASAGICGIDVASIKRIKKKKDICNVLSTCYNEYFDAGFFPDCLKISRVIPVRESGLKSKLDNYTFVLALPVFSKIFEKLLWKRINSFAPIHYVTENQYGYQEKPNTVLRMIDIVSKINTSIHKKENALGLFIDLEEALYKVEHSLLLKKLESLGVSDLALKMIESYFANRKHVVTKGTSEKSKLRDIKRGVPQGSILGHLLFLIYLNGVTNLHLNGDITLSAEKISLFYYDLKVEDIFEKAGQDLDSLSRWFRENCLVINPKNICYVIFAKEQEEKPTSSSGATRADDEGPEVTNDKELKYCDTKIEQAKEAELFGLILDSGLTWRPHILKIKTILISFVESLKFNSQCPKYSGLVFYNACVRSQANYLIEAWGASPEIKTLGRLLTELENKLNVHGTARNTQRQKTHGVLSLTEAFVYKSCILAYKTLSAYNTSSNEISLDALKSDYGTHSISYAGAVRYNQLPSEVRNEFKKKLHCHLYASRMVAVANDASACAYKCTSPKCAEKEEVFKSPKERQDHRDIKHKGVQKGKRLFVKA